jgi:sugar lactone lactonase YvrE
MTEPCQAELILDAMAVLGEGPCWDHRSGLLYWVDIAAKKIHAYDPRSGKDQAVQLDQMVGTAVPRQSAGGGVIAALERGLHLLDLETAKLSLLDDPERGMENNRFNDGKCDAAGRFWAGTMNRNEEGPTGSLYCLEHGRPARKALGGLTISNGLGWSPDGRTMYHIDTPTRQVVAYDFDAVRGEISRGRTVVTIPAEDGYPDGMTVDAEGMLWIAHWGGGQVSRWNPQLGKRLTVIKIPAECVSACTFGGPELDELYITTARIGQTEENLAKQPHAGGLFRVKPGVTGLPAHFYAG